MSKIFFIFAEQILDKYVDKLMMGLILNFYLIKWLNEEP